MKSANNTGMVKAHAEKDIPDTSDIVLQPSHVKLFKFVEKYIATNIVSPQVDEIASAVKLTQRQCYRLIDDLCKLGYLEKKKYRTRGLKILFPLE